jgi:TonB-linked SusC/RagA family outer membrane protein
MNNIYLSNQFLYLNDMKKKTLLISCMALALCAPYGAKAETARPSNEAQSVLQSTKTIPQVKGKVSDNNGEPIIGASVIVKGTTNGAVTDMDGNYSLTNVPAGATIVVSYVGFLPQELVVNSSSMRNISMHEDNKTLEELVVIGYGTQRKADLTGSVANVDASKLNTQSNTTIGQALQGKIAGVDIVSQGGTPGSGSRIMVRGIGTLNNAAPLYIVDGMYMSSIDHINPSDIQSIDVLKDASSAAIYGSRAANGVVIITTKSGSNTDGVPSINLTANIGVNAPSKYLDLLNAQEWSQVTTASRAASGLQPLDMAQDLSTKEDNDWQDIMFNPALMQNYNLSVQGGGKYTTYYNSFGYTNQDGTMKGTNFQRYTMQSKFDLKKGMFNMGTNIILEYDKDKPMVSEIRGGMVGHTILAIPTLSRYDADNTGGYGGLYGDVVNLYHPLGMCDDNLMRRRRDNAKVYANVYFSLEPVKGLKYKLNFTPDFQFYRYNNYRGLYDFGLNKNGITQVNEQQTRTRNMLLENLLTFDRTFGDHKISLLAGYSYQDTRYRYLSGSGQGMSDGILELDAAASGLTAAGNSSRSVLTSILGRAFYSYKDRYLITATIRRDGSSKFGKNHHYGNFPSVSLGWNIAEENFVKKNVKWLDQLKLRAGYGELGNQEIDNYQYSSVVTTGINYPDGNGGLIKGAFPKNFANPDIKWESTAMTNIGLDLLALNSRLSLTMDYYVKNTSDILLEVPIPISTGGANDPVRNAGKIRNKGFEFNLGWTDRPTSDFSYSVNAIGSFNKNKVVAMGSESQFITGGTVHGGTYTTKTLAGYPIGGFWLIPCDGYFNSAEEVQAYSKNGVQIQPSAEPGDIRFKDTNDDGTINDGDRVYCGSPFPDFTYSLNGSVTYRNFDFAITLQGVLGNKIYNATRLELEDVTRGTNYLSDVLDSWSETNHNASVPRLVWTDPNRNARSESDRFLESGSYLRLRTIQLGYTLPKNLFDGFIKTARVYVDVDNLFTITGYKGYTPDVNASSVYQRGFDEFIYPANRTFMLGINLSF